MKEASAPKHSTELIQFDDYAEKFKKKGVPRWKARRVAVSMSHSDTVETKIIHG